MSEPHQQSDKIPSQDPPSYSQSPPATSDLFPQATGPAESVAPLPHHSPKPQFSEQYHVSPYPQSAHPASAAPMSPQPTGKDGGYYSPQHDPHAQQQQQYQQQQHYGQHPQQQQQHYDQYAQGHYSPQPDQQGGIPLQSQPQQPWQPEQQNSMSYGSVTPLYALGSAPTPINCPSCNQRAMTRVTLETGNTTHAWAAGLLITTCCCCIPYCVPQTKDVEHKCGNCGIRVATWHRSGRTEVHAH